MFFTYSINHLNQVSPVTLTCAHLVQACEARGFQTYWNCNTQNVAFVKIARKLGYCTEKEYRLLYWSKV